MKAQLYRWAWQRALAGRPGALTRVFWRMIPFNRPHRFRIAALSSGAATVQTSLRRANRNHLGTLHACALATAGEFAAGLALLGAFSPIEYRLIMSRLEVDYTRRADRPVTAEASIARDDLEALQSDLAATGIAQRVVITTLTADDGQKVAEVRTHWQIKDWRRTAAR